MDTISQSDIRIISIKIYFTLKTQLGIHLGLVELSYWQ